VARGNAEGRRGRRSHSNAVTTHAGQLAVLRLELDGMSGDDPAFAPTLLAAIQAGADLMGRATRMDPDGLSRRAACANIVTTSEMLLVKERNSHMSHNTAPQLTHAPEGASAGEYPNRHLRLVTDLGATALAPMDEQHPFYEDWDHHTADMPMQGV
jgi:hypothetical protein